MPPSSIPNLDAIKPQPLPSNAALRQGEKEDDWFAKDKKERAHFREQQAKNVIHYMILVIIFSTAFCLAGAIIIRAYHLLFPQKWMWLTPEQIKTLDHLGKFAVTGALGGLLTKYLNKNSEQ